MIELISIICSLVVCILTPIEVAKIRRGWVRKKFNGSSTEFIVAYRKQLNMLTWLGIVFGLIGIVLALFMTTGGDAVVKLVAGVIWLTVACIAFVCRRMLLDVPVAGSPSPSDA